MKTYDYMFGTHSQFSQSPQPAPANCVLIAGVVLAKVTCNYICGEEAGKTGVEAERKKMEERKLTNLTVRGLLLMSRKFGANV